MPGIYADLEACRSMNRQAVWGTWFDSRLFGVDLVVSWTPPILSFWCLGCSYPLFTNKTLVKNWLQVSDHVRRTVISPGRWKQVFAPAMKRCHAWNVNAMKAVFMPYLGKLWEVKIWRSFEDGSWRLWRFIYFYILMQPPCFLRVFCMDISHLRFVWRQVLCQRGSWQGQGWKSIQTCLMMVLWCPMLAKC